MSEQQEDPGSLFSLELKSDRQVRSIGVWRATFLLPGEPLSRAGDIGCPPLAKKSRYQYTAFFDCVNDRKPLARHALDGSISWQA
jgi:hypothetical protein